jgi:hypothetical protein
LSVGLSESRRLDTDDSTDRQPVALTHGASLTQLTNVPNLDVITIDEQEYESPGQSSENVQLAKGPSAVRLVSSALSLNRLDQVASSDPTAAVIEIFCIDEKYAGFSYLAIPVRYDLHCFHFE